MGKNLEALQKLVSDTREAIKEKKASNEEAKKRADEALELEKKAREEAAVTRKGEFSDDKTEDEKAPNKILVAKSRDPKIQEYQHFCDDVYILSKILKTHPSRTKLWNESRSMVSDLRKAMSAGTSGSGNEWVPTELSAELMDKVRLELKVAALFETIPMPTNPYDLPWLGGDVTGYFVSENTSDTGTKIKASTPTTKKTTLSAVKLAARTLFSEEVNEDSIVPILPFIKNNQVTALATAKEKAIINGDVASPHQDGNVTDPNDAQKAFDGLRKMVKAANVVDLSTFNINNLREMRRKLGKYGVDPKKLAWIVSVSGWIKMQTLAELITVDKYGQFATVLSGELGKLDGIPIIVSEFVYDNLNALAKYDATVTNKTAIILVYRTGFINGDRRKVTVKTWEDVENDQQVVVATQRVEFEDIYDASTEDMIAIGRNVTLTI